MDVNGTFVAALGAISKVYGVDQFGHKFIGKPLALKKMSLVPKANVVAETIPLAFHPAK